MIERDAIILGLGFFAGAIYALIFGYLLEKLKQKLEEKK